MDIELVTYPRFIFIEIVSIDPGEPGNQTLIMMLRIIVIIMLIIIVIWFMHVLRLSSRVANCGGY